MWDSYSVGASCFPTVVFWFIGHMVFHLSTVVNHFKDRLLHQKHILTSVRKNQVFYFQKAFTLEQCTCTAQWKSDKKGSRIQNYLNNWTVGFFPALNTRHTPHWSFNI